MEAVVSRYSYLMSVVILLFHENITDCHRGRSEIIPPTHEHARFSVSLFGFTKQHHYQTAPHAFELQCYISVC